MRLFPWSTRERTPPPAPFVVGAGGSGTTTLRLMLDAHPQLAVPPETHFLPALAKAARGPAVTPHDLVEVIVADRRWTDFGFSREELERMFENIRPVNARAAARAFYRAYAERYGKPRWGDKTPRYARFMKRIQRLLPEARFVHLIRDGRDVRLSRARRVEEPPPIEVAAKRWRSRIERSRKIARELPHYLEIRFEDLIGDTEATLRQVCEFVELDFDPAMLTYYETAPERLAEMSENLPDADDKQVRPGTRLERKRSSLRPPDPSMIGRWRERMTPDERIAYESVAGDLLVELGYQLGASP